MPSSYTNSSLSVLSHDYQLSPCETVIRNLELFMKERHMPSTTEERHMELFDNLYDKHYTADLQGKMFNYKHLRKVTEQHYSNPINFNYKVKDFDAEILDNTSFHFWFTYDFYKDGQLDNSNRIHYFCTVNPVTKKLLTKKPMTGRAVIDVVTFWLEEDKKQERIKQKQQQALATENAKLTCSNSCQKFLLLEKRLTFSKKKLRKSIGNVSKFLRFNV